MCRSPPDSGVGIQEIDSSVPTILQHLRACVCVCVCVRVCVCVLMCVFIGIDPPCQRRRHSRECRCDKDQRT